MAKGKTPDVLGDMLRYGTEHERPQALGEEEKEPKKAPEGIRVNVYLNEPLLNRAKDFAQRRHWNTSLLIREALEEYLAEHDKI